MSYGLKYQATFDSFKGPLESYVVNIYQKDFEGENSTLLLSGTPVVQEWQIDDHKAPIRGCTLNVSILSDANGVKLIDFYSEDDNEFYVEFICSTTDQYLFKGYLLQEDCKEIQIDFNHEISLTFSDMLGTLKDITINQAAEIVGTLTTINGIDFYNPSPVANNAVCSFNTAASVLNPGDNFILYDGVNTYNLVCISNDYNIALGYIIGIGVPCPFSGTVTFDFTYKIPYPLDGYIPLIDVLKLCLKSTLLNIGLRSLVSIFPEGTASESTWDAAFIDAQTLKSDENNWMNCYDVLENLMTRFNASLFQANAIWHIVRWDEMYRYTTTAGATMYGTGYNNNFVSYGTITSTANFIFMNGSDMETGVMKSLERPYQYVKETFNYVQPTDIVKNPNLQELGVFIREYVDANNDLIKEYVLPYWVNPQDQTTGPFADRFIRIAYYNDITQKNFGEEKYRNIVVTGNSALHQGAVQSNDIYLSQRDRVYYSFQYASGLSMPGSFYRQIYVTFRNSTTLYYLDVFGNWTTTLSYNEFHIQSGDNEQEWHTWEFYTPDAPTDGILNFYLFESDPYLGSNEYYFKEFTCRIDSYYAGSKKVIGQTHTDSQIQQIKNNDSKDIFFDDSPSWYIKGTIYQSTTTNLLRDRANSWGYPLYFPIPVPDRFAYNNLGKATTQESLFTRFKPRAKYEGNLLYVKQGSGPYIFVNPMSVFKWYLNQSLYRFVPGKMTIDYKNSSVNLTLFELIDNMGGDFNEGIIAQYRNWRTSRIYEFNYLYENK